MQIGSTAKKAFQSLLFGDFNKARPNQQTSLPNLNFSDFQFKIGSTNGFRMTEVAGLVLIGNFPMEVI